MKLIAPLTAIIAAASAGQIYAGHSAENYANSAELYQSGLEYQQRGLYSDQSQAAALAGHDATYNSRPAAEKTAKILGFNVENNGHQYKYSYETENGIKAQEVGETSEHGTVAHGAYSYTDDHGQTITVTYTADENGFHPQGDHLPTPPPIPEEIQKSLEQNAKDEAAGIFDDGKYNEQSGHGVSQGHQQIEANYQTLGYQGPSGHAGGAELAYHAHSGLAQSGLSDSAALAYHGQSGHAFTSPSAGAHLAYHTQSAPALQGHSSGADFAYHARSAPAQLSHSTGAAALAHQGHSSSADMGHTGMGFAHQAHLGSAHPGHASGAELAFHGYH